MRIKERKGMGEKKIYEKKRGRGEENGIPKGNKGNC